MLEWLSAPQFVDFCQNYLYSIESKIFWECSLIVVLCCKSSAKNFSWNYENLSSQKFFSRTQKNAWSIMSVLQIYNRGNVVFYLRHKANLKYFMTCLKSENRRQSGKHAFNLENLWLNIFRCNVQFSSPAHLLCKSSVITPWFIVILW